MISEQALIRHNQISRLRTANLGDLRFLREWLDHEEGGNLFLQGREARPWDARYGSDLISVKRTDAEKDHVHSWIDQRFFPWYHRTIGHRLQVSPLEYTTSSHKYFS